MSLSSPAMKRQCISDLRKIFQQAVNSVHPATLFSTGKCLERLKTPGGGEVLQIGDESIVATGKKCHLVGFGKAVLGMAVQVERILGDALVSGIVSIPTGTLEKFKSAPEMKLTVGSVVQVQEGGKDNLPDEMAMRAAGDIKRLAESMTQDDILIVLISGGGSALLPLPIEEITLQQKTELIRNLARKGADIEELNIVRIAMSQIKGGKLAQAAGQAHKIISLIISDIVNDPLHLIASGPTVEFKSDGRSAQSILQKFDTWNQLNSKIQNALLKNNETRNVVNNNNSVLLIASNETAASAAMSCSTELGYKSCILSTSIVGALNELVTKYPFEKNSFSKLIATIHSCKPGDKICLIMAGEPTALVTGDGKGGRNQELALRMSEVFHKNSLLGSITFLSAGTDGIDGLTDAAGAIGCTEVVEEFLKGSSMEEFKRYIERNDSYNFYKRTGNGKYHIVTGHTGTNVMDIHLAIVPIPPLGKL